MRERIFEASATAFFLALWKSTKSFFGARRVKGNRGACGKTTVWHLRVGRSGLYGDRSGLLKANVTGDYLGQGGYPYPDQQ